MARKPQPCRLTLVGNGSFDSPLGQTPIDMRWSEEILTGSQPLVDFLDVDDETEIFFGRIVSPRCVIVQNVAGFDATVYPTSEEAAELAKHAVHVGPPECPRLCLLPPRTLGKTPQGCSQPFWLSPGQRLVISPVVAGVSVPVRVLVFPASEPESPAAA